MQSDLYLGEEAEVEEECVSGEGDAVVGHHCGHDAVLVLDVLHAAADAVEGEHEGLRAPEAQEGAEQREVEDEVADVGQVLLLVVLLQGLTRILSTFCRKSRQQSSSVSGFTSDSTTLSQKCSCAPSPRSISCGRVSLPTRMIRMPQSVSRRKALMASSRPFLSWLARLARSEAQQGQQLFSRERCWTQRAMARRQKSWVRSRMRTREGKKMVMAVGTSCEQQRKAFCAALRPNTPPYIDNRSISIILEKDDLDGDVVDVLVLPLPRLHRPPLQHLHRLLRVVPHEGRHRQLQHLLVPDELPQPVRSHHQELVLLAHLAVGHFRLAHHAHRRGHVVPEGTRHGQAGDVLLLDPDAEGAHLLALLVQVGEDAAAVHLDAVGLALVLGLVVEGERLALPLLAHPAEEHCAGVAQVGAEEVLLVQVEQAGGGAREVDVDARLLEVARGLREGVLERSLDERLAELLDRLVLQEEVLDVLGQDLLDEVRDEVPVHPVPVAHPEQVPLLHHEVLNQDVRVLVHLLLLVHRQPAPVDQRVLGDQVERRRLPLVLRQQLPPLRRRHLDVLLRLRLGVLRLPRLLPLPRPLLQLVLVLAQRADRLLVQLLLLPLPPHAPPEEVQVLYLHVYADLRRLLEIGEGELLGGGGGGAGSALLGRVELALAGVLEVLLAEVVIAGGGGEGLLALGTAGLLHQLILNISLESLEYQALGPLPQRAHALLPHLRVDRLQQPPQRPQQLRPPLLRQLVHHPVHVLLEDARLGLVEGRHQPRQLLHDHRLALLHAVQRPVAHVLRQHPLLDARADRVEELLGRGADLGLGGREADEDLVEDDAEAALDEGGQLPGQLLEDPQRVQRHLHVGVVDLLAQHVHHPAARTVLQQGLAVLETHLRHLPHALQPHLPVTALAALQVRVELVELGRELCYLVLLLAPRKLLLLLRLSRNSRLFHYQGAVDRLRHFGRRRRLVSLLELIAVLKGDKLEYLPSSLACNDAVQQILGLFPYLERAFPHKIDQDSHYSLEFLLIELGQEGHSFQNVDDGSLYWDGPAQMGVGKHRYYLCLVAVGTYCHQGPLHFLGNEGVCVQTLLYQLRKNQVELCVQKLLHLAAQLIQHYQCVLAQGGPQTLCQPHEVRHKGLKSGQDQQLRMVDDDPVQFVEGFITDLPVL